MATITDLVRFLIRRRSNDIHRMKAQGVVKETRVIVAFVSPDGKTFISRRKARLAEHRGWKLGRARFQRVSGFMSPRHPDWKNYRAARRQASVLLTARLLLKLGGESVPAFDTVRAALEDGWLSRHARRGRDRGLCFEAYRYLKKLDNRIARRPEILEVVDRFLASRQSSRISAEPCPDESMLGV